MEKKHLDTFTPATELDFVDTKKTYDSNLKDSMTEHFHSAYFRPNKKRDGHNPVEDALASVLLVHKWLEDPPIYCIWCASNAILWYIILSQHCHIYYIHTTKTTTSQYLTFIGIIAWSHHYCTSSLVIQKY